MTHNALRHITDNVRVLVLNGIVMLPYSKTWQPNVQVGGYLPQFTTISLVTNNTTVRVAGQHEFHQYPACFYDLGGVGMYCHTFRDRSMTGASQCPGALNLDYTKAARPEWREAFQITQGGNMNSILPRYFKNSHPFTPTKWTTIHC